jgi:hypothetical protein
MLHYKFMLQKKEPKTMKTNSLITCYEWTLQDWPQKLTITNQMDNKMLDDWEDGMYVYGGGGSWPLHRNHHWSTVRPLFD